jgi:hypothetical protein
MRKSLFPAAALLLALCASPQIWPHDQSTAEAAVVKDHRAVRHWRHHWAYRHETASFAAPRAQALRSSRNGCSNDDCIGINSSNGLGGSGGF